jgi:hypothetical protein
MDGPRTPTRHLESFKQHIGKLLMPINKGPPDFFTTCEKLERQL